MPSTGRADAPTSGVAPAGGTSLRNQAFVLVLCAQAASGIVSGAAPMALPAIRSSFDTSSAAIQWYAALYSLGFALVLILAGRIGDLFGTRRLLLIGYATFIASIIGSALAPTIGVLLVFRLLQGVGAGVMAPQLSAMVQRTFQGHDRTRAFAVFLMVAGGTFMVGQLVSGALITADVWGLSWRWVYLPSIPFALVTLAVAFRRLPATAPGPVGRLDVGGAVVLSAASFLLMFPLIQGRSAGWPTWIVVMILAAAPAYGAFLAYERRLIGRGGDPLVDPALFRIRSFGVGNLITVAVALLGGAAPIYLILLIQSGFDRSALEAAILTAPMPFLNMFGSLAAAPLVRRFGRGSLVIGGVLVALAAVLILLVARGDPESVSPVALVPGLGLTGFSVGVIMAAAMAIVLHEVPAAVAGSAAGVQSTSLQLFSAVGIAFFGMIFYGTIGESTDLESYLDAIRNVEWIVVGIALVQVAMSFLMPRHRIAATEELTPVDPEMSVLPDFHEPV